MKKIASIIFIFCLSSNNLYAMEKALKPAVQYTLEFAAVYPKTAAVISFTSSAASVYCFEKAMTSDSPFVTIGGISTSFALSLGAITVCPSKDKLNDIVTGTLFFSTFASKFIPKPGSPFTQFFTNTICAAMFNYSIKQVITNLLYKMGDTNHIWDTPRQDNSILEEEEE